MGGEDKKETKQGFFDFITNPFKNTKRFIGMLLMIIGLGILAYFLVMYFINRNSSERAQLARSFAARQYGNHTDASWNEV